MENDTLLDASQAQAVAQRYNDILLNEPYRATELAAEAMQYTIRETGATEAAVQEASRAEYEDLDPDERRYYIYFYSYLSKHGL